MPKQPLVPHSGLSTKQHISWFDPVGSPVGGMCSPGWSSFLIRDRAVAAMHSGSSALSRIRLLVDSNNHSITALSCTTPVVALHVGSVWMSGAPSTEQHKVVSSELVWCRMPLAVVLVSMAQRQPSRSQRGFLLCCRQLAAIAPSSASQLASKL